MPEERLSLQEIEPADLAIINEFYELEKQAKAIKDRQADLRADLVDIMEDYAVKSWENNLFKISYVAPTTRTGVNSAKLKKEYPDVYKQVLKTSDVKASVRVTLR